MAKEYLVDEFIGRYNACTYKDQVDKKISLLYDLYILYKQGKRADRREAAVRELLSSYQSEIQMDNAVHNIVLGDDKLNNLLKRKGFLQ